MTKYDDYDWKELPAEAKKAAEALGYNKKMWDKDKDDAASKHPVGINLAASPVCIRTSANQASGQSHPPPHNGSNVDIE
ncbi:hypothetical protein THAOC_25528, partial [Thalassiosira oceanica]